MFWHDWDGLIEMLDFTPCNAQSNVQFGVSGLFQNGDYNWQLCFYDLGQNSLEKGGQPNEWPNDQTNKKI